MAHGKRILCGLNRAADLYRFNDDAVAVTGGEISSAAILIFRSSCIFSRTACGTVQLYRTVWSVCVHHRYDIMCHNSPPTNQSASCIDRRHSDLSQESMKFVLRSIVKQLVGAIRKFNKILLSEIRGLINECQRRKIHVGFMT